MTKNNVNFVASIDKRIAIEKKNETCESSMKMLYNAKQIFSNERVAALFADAAMSQDFALQRVNVKALIDIKSINRLAYFAQYAAKAKLFTDKNNDKSTLATLFALHDAKLTITRSALEAACTTKAEAKRYKHDASIAAKIVHRNSINDAKTCQRQAQLLINAYRMMNVIRETTTNVFELNDNALVKALRASLTDK